MSYSERRARHKRLGEKLHRRLTPEEQIDVELQCIDISITNYDAIREMVESPGWEILSTLINDFVEQEKNRVIDCAADPDKYRTKQITSYAMMKTGQRILGTVSSTLKEGPHLFNRKRELTND